ncbi:amidohydrolase [Enterococcus sp. OL5]|uniref:amidohydrolase n=1 Tax=Enterococcus sp. OL5 TaxID=2590214 RepID=UPI0011272F65|nr:amidohydrolase [Enterococcus sp. OL5]TPR55115.1 amidohydrolase [Enterococcus sp. OL5]
MTDEKALENFLIDYRRKMHQHPELSTEEYQTTADIRRVLTDHGIPIVETPLKTGVVAKIKGATKGPVIALRADIDALPIVEQSGVPYASEFHGKMHACGHDFHTSVILGAAILLNQQKEKLHGTVLLIFQAAEEIAQGASKVIESGVLNDVEAIFGFHNDPSLPVGTLGTKVGELTAAVDRFEINIKGNGAHGAKPHEGVDPLVVIAQIIQAFQPIISRNLAPDSHAVLSITQVHSGETWNVIPDRAYLEGTVRNFSAENRTKVEHRIRATLEGIALANEIGIELIWHASCPSVTNDQKWTEVSLKASEEAGFATRIIKESAIGEDFAYYQEKIPGSFVMIGSGGPYELHHPKFRVDDRALFPAVKYFEALAFKVLA